MTNDAQRIAKLTRYLLGEVSQQERDEIEDGYSRDDDLFEDLIAAENDLIDDYVHDKLSETEKGQFERHFLSNPERREQVRFARSLMLAGGDPTRTAEDAKPLVRSRPASWTPALRWAVAAGLLVTLAGLSWLAMANRRLHDQLEAVRAGQAAAQRQAQELRQQVTDLQQAIAQARNQQTGLPPGSTRLSLMLVPGLARGNGRQVTLPLSPGISQVQFILKHEGDEAATSYDVVLETADGRRIWQKENLTGSPAGKEGNIVTVEIPATILKRDDYVLRLLQPVSGAKPGELSVYSFRVLRP